MELYAMEIASLSTALPPPRPFADPRIEFTRENMQIKGGRFFQFADLFKYVNLGESS